MKTILIVLDSVGIGAAPDAAKFGDAGSATLPHLAAAVNGIEAPTFQAMGLGNIPELIPGGIPIQGVPPCSTPIASYAAMQEQSDGKDTITGHWELAGLHIDPGFHVFPPDAPSFPDDLLQAFRERTGRGTIGNKAASGVPIINELGPEHMKSGDLIVYTSADSVFQIAAHTDIVPIEELYRACEIARELCDRYKKVGRIIARPFTGEPGSFVRTEQRRDFAYTPDEKTLLEHLTGNDIPVYAVGKIEDIYAHRGITESVHTGNTVDSQQEVIRLTKEKSDGLIFANFIDFDMLYGHPRDPVGYARAVEQTDGFLRDYLPMLTEDDVLLITADHGNDPTFKGTDHTREYVPLLVYQPGRPGRNLGIRQGFYDVSQSIAHFLGIGPLARGVNFL